MPEREVSPLNNPLSEKAVDEAIPYNDNDDKRVKRDSKGGKGRVQPAEAIVKCQMCGHYQKIVFGYGKAPEWHRCIWCGELQPADGYRVTMYGLGLPRVLAPHEVAARATELSRQRGAK